MLHRLRFAAPVALACVAAAGGTTLRAIYVAQETRRVPVARLVENLERKLVEDPDNVQHHVNLGRLHGMAFALKTEEVPAVVREGGVEEPWYGYEPKLIPYAGKAAPSKETAVAAEAHLRKALSHYETALRLDANNRLALLGRAWMLQHAGQTNEAIEGYRRVISLAWPAERDTRVLVPQQRLFTAEAIGYLIPLLNPETDKQEIADLRTKQESLSRLPRAITPIAIPLRSGIPSSRIHDPAARVRFDADGSGLAREWSWTSADVGWLVHDAGGAGSITSALQLFGNVTFWLFWDNGYEALSALDDDGDGEIGGSERRELAVWHDANRNARSDAGEVRPLESLGIDSLSYGYEQGDGVTFAAVSPHGVRLQDGTTRPTYDVLLRSARSLTRAHPAPRILSDRAGEHQ